MRTADEAISPRLDRVSCRMLRPKHPCVSLTSGGLEASRRIGRGAPTPRSIRYRSAPSVRETVLWPPRLAPHAATALRIHGQPSAPGPIRRTHKNQLRVQDIDFARETRSMCASSALSFDSSRANTRNNESGDWVQPSCPTPSAPGSRRRQRSGPGNGSFLRHAFTSRWMGQGGDIISTRPWSSEPLPWPSSGRGSASGPPATASAIRLPHTCCSIPMTFARFSNYWVTRASRRP